MSRIVFVTWAGGGNLPPALGIAAALTRRGHEARFVGHALQGGAIEGRGFRFEAFRHAAPWPPTGPPDPSGPPPSVRVFTDRGMGDDVVESLARDPADLVVVDHLLWGVLQATFEHGIPSATLVHTFFGQQRTTWSRTAGADLARGLGFEPVALWEASRVIVIATLPELDAVHPGELPANARFAGPVWQGVPSPAVPEPLPLVLVSLSTMPQEGQAEAFQRILDALAPLPVRAVATAPAGMGATAVRCPGNVELTGFIPHETLMQRASLVISHGGHSTAMAALSRDVPMLLMPMFLLGDQPVVAGAIEAAGAGIALGKEAGVDDIRQAVARVLDGSEGSGCRAAAARLGALIRRRDGAEAAADAIASAVGEPIHR